MSNNTSLVWKLHVAFALLAIYVIIIVFQCYWCGCGVSLRVVSGDPEMFIVLLNSS